jgi:hypothetical protein
MTRDALLRMLDEAYDRRSWHGTNLRGSLRGVTPASASWRPAPGRHNIWELTVHAAYWKYAVRRRLLGEKRGSFPLEGSNWFERPITGAAGAAQWRSDLRLLADQHRVLRQAVASLPDKAWAKRAPRSPFDNQSLVTGIAAHDLYHAGQIQLLKRLRHV